MRVAVFSTKTYDREFFTAANKSSGHELVFYEPRLTAHTVRLAESFPAVCAFVNDELDAHVLLALSRHDTKLIAMRSAGFNNVDLLAAEQLGLTVTRVPAYSPHAVAEHTVAMILALAQAAQGLQSRSRGQLLPRRTAGLRHPRPHGRSDRHGQDRLDRGADPPRLRLRTARLRSAPQPRRRSTGRALRPGRRAVRPLRHHLAPCAALAGELSHDRRRGHCA